MRVGVRGAAAVRVKDPETHTVFRPTLPSRESDRLESQQPNRIQSSPSKGSHCHGTSKRDPRNLCVLQWASEVRPGASRKWESEQEGAYTMFLHHMAQV